jgi:type II secretory pathway pseudopilin PulG
MKALSRRRRGVILAALMMVLALLAAIFAVLSTVLVSVHDARRLEQLQRAARNAADSAAALVQRDPESWNARLADGPVEIDIDAMLPAQAEGTATLQWVEGVEHPSASIHVQVARSRMTARVTREVGL